MTLVRTRVLRVALPLCLALAAGPLGGLGPAPASAQEAAPPAPAYRGYLQEDAAGDLRYLAVEEATGRTVATSRPDAVDGALQQAAQGAPSIAYVSERSSGEVTSHVLRLAAPDGTDRVLASLAPDDLASEPVFSPDGSRLAYVVDGRGGSALRLHDLATGSSSAVRASRSTTYYGPSFSPDGSYLSWAQETDRGSDLVTARLATGAASVVASSVTVSYDDTSWSPDGTRLVATRADLDDDADPGALVLVDLRTGAEQVLVRGTLTTGGGTLYGQPTWAPDGSAVHASRVVLTRTSASLSLVRLPVSGAPVEVVPTTGYAGSPSLAGPRPTGDSTAPAPVSEVTVAVSGRTARLRYQLPLDSDLADVVVTRVEGEPSATHTAATEVTRSRTGVVDVLLPSPGTEYGIALFSRDWSGNLSPAATVRVTSPQASALTLAAPPAEVAFRTPVRFAGRLTSAGEPVSGQRVVLLARRAGTRDQLAVASATTRADGTYSLAVTPSATAEHQVRYDGSATHAPSLSPKRVTSVVPLVSLQLSASRVARGGTVVLSGSVAPSHAGQVVSVQRSVDGVWRTVGSTRLSSTSSYRYALRPGTRGTWTLRVVRPADADHLAGTSPTRTLAVR